MKKKKRVLIIMAEGVEELELTAPTDVLRRLNLPVTLCGVGGLTVRGAHGLCLSADIPIEEVDPKEYDALIVPGGPAARTLARDQRVLELVRAMHAAKPSKLLAAICAAPMVLAAAGVLSKEQTVTCYPAADVMQAVNATAKMLMKPVIREGNLITGMGPASALEFAFAIAAALAGDSAEAQLRRDMCSMD